MFENERDAKFEAHEVVPSIQEQEASLDFDLADFYKKFELKQHTTEEIEEDKIKHKVFPTKTSYSALKKINGANNINFKKEKRGYLELNTLKSLTSTSKAILRGNIVHKLFEKIVNDIKSGVEINGVEAYLNNLKKTDDLFKNIKESRILTEEEFNNINNKDDIERIGNFINNELMDIINNCQFCQTEIAFTTAKKAKELYSESDSEIDVILQGVVDLFIKISDDEAIIVDYKTDYVTSKTGEDILRERHKEQLRIYKEAVAEYYQLKNIKTYVYSYVLSKLIEVE